MGKTLKAVARKVTARPMPEASFSPSDGAFPNRLPTTSGIRNIMPK